MKQKALKSSSSFEGILHNGIVYIDIECVRDEYFGQYGEVDKAN